MYLPTSHIETNKSSKPIPRRAGILTRQHTEVDCVAYRQNPYEGTQNVRRTKKRGKRRDGLTRPASISTPSQKSATPTRCGVKKGIYTLQRQTKPEHKASSHPSTTTTPPIPMMPNIPRTPSAPATTTDPIDSRIQLPSPNQSSLTGTENTNHSAPGKYTATRTPWHQPTQYRRTGPSESGSHPSWRSWWSRS